LLKTIPAQYYITKELSEEEQVLIQGGPNIWIAYLYVEQVLDRAEALDSNITPSPPSSLNSFVILLQNSKYQHNKKRNAPKQEIKERTKKAKKAKVRIQIQQSHMLVCFLFQLCFQVSDPICTKFSDNVC
jgi:hypothetical protein